MEHIHKKNIYEIYLPKHEKIISNNLAKELIRGKLTSTETAIIFVIGSFIFDKKNEYDYIELSYSDFVKITNISRRQIIISMNKLCEKEIILKKSYGRKNFWSE